MPQERLPMRKIRDVLRSRPAAYPSVISNALPTLIDAARIPPISVTRTRDDHTQRRTEEFLTWCECSHIPSIAAAQPVHVATHIEQLVRVPTQKLRHARTTVKARLAAVRHLLDWLVIGQVAPINPAAKRLAHEFT
jgi:hypothetical protein